MKKTVKKLAANPLISGTFFIFSGGIVANLFNFLFNLSLSRNLKVEDYGAIVSLTSIILLAAIPVSALIPTIVSISGAAFAKKDTAGLKAFYVKLFKPLLLGSILFVLVSLLSLEQLSNFLHVESWTLLALAVIAIVIGYIGTLNYGFLQGRLAFKTLSFGNALASFVKFALGFLLVMLGFGVHGAMVAFVIASAIPVLIGYYILKDILFAKVEKLSAVSFRELFRYGIPSSIAIFSLNSFISTDIILVKHFFPPEQAGLYAGLSLVGKVIYYLTAPIATVMFPTIIQRYNTNQNYMRIFMLSVGLVLVASISIGFFYQIVPEFAIIFFLKNVQYLEVAPYLGLFAVFISIFSVISILTYFFLSINKTRIFIFVALGAVLQMLLIVFFHASYVMVIIDSIVALSLLLFILLIYYFITQKNKDAKQ